MNDGSWPLERAFRIAIAARMQPSALAVRRMSTVTCRRRIAVGVCMQKRSRFNSAAAIGACLLVFTGAVAAGPPTFAGKRPNVILIITDDQGYGDLGRHGNPV